MIKKIIGTFLLFIISLSFGTNSIQAAKTAGQSANFKEKGIKQLDKTKTNRLFIKEMAIDSVLKKEHSPMISNSADFIKSCVKYNLDCYLLPAIAGVESGFGKHILRQSYNPFGWRGGYQKFANFDEAIQTVSYGLKIKYIACGAKNIKMIGRKYSVSPTWPAKVEYFTKKFSKEEERLNLYSKNLPLEF